MTGTRGKFTFLAIIFQIVFLILFATLAEYDTEASPSTGNDTDYETEDQNVLSNYYGMFQDVHVMIFIGFGFLMTFLKRYGFGSIGFNFLLGAFALQWAMLMHGFLEMSQGQSYMHIDIMSLLTADFAAATVLISFGAVLGKTSGVQLMVMAFIEIVLALVNEHIGYSLFGAVDVGESMFVHVFGAYFGLACARVLYKDGTVDNAKEGSEYHSDLFSMIGTIFLWIFWPSFNSAATVPNSDEQNRAVINTYLALCACCVTAFAISSILNKENKIEMVHIQNSTLAGGVAVGAVANLMIEPWGAILIGMVAASISVLGFKYLTPVMASKARIHDTCGVHNLHGMPGVLAAIASCLAAAVATSDIYGSDNNLYKVYSERDPDNSGRSAGKQALFQLAALATTLCIAIVGGALTGLVLRLPIWDAPKRDQYYDDLDYWEGLEEDKPLSSMLSESMKDGDQKVEETRMSEA